MYHNVYVKMIRDFPSFNAKFLDSRLYGESFAQSYKVIYQTEAVRCGGPRGEEDQDFGAQMRGSVTTVFSNGIHCVSQEGSASGFEVKTLRSMFSASALNFGGGHPSARLWRWS